MSGLAKRLANVGQLLTRRRPVKIQGRNLSGSGVENYKYTWRYREQPKPDRNSELLADVMMGGFWYWVLFHFYYDPEMAIPMSYSKYPDPAKWTDEELGIPPIDAE